MKKAFTMFELIFVIVIIGIITAVIMPKNNSNALQEAATQVVSHIKYTQHLAMINDKFNPSSGSEWYKKRWQIKFSNTNGSDNRWAYAIFADENKDGNPNGPETAVNPLDASKKLTGGYSNGTIAYNDDEATKKLNIGHAYGIKDIDFSSGCNISNDDGKKRIFFDKLGRPYTDNPETLENTFETSSKSLLLTESCTITICNVSDCSSAGEKEKETIVLEAESGYVHILN